MTNERSTGGDISEVSEQATNPSLLDRQTDVAYGTDAALLAEIAVANLNSDIDKSLDPAQKDKLTAEKFNTLMQDADIITAILALSERDPARTPPVGEEGATESNLLTAIIQQEDQEDDGSAQKSVKSRTKRVMFERENNNEISITPPSDDKECCSCGSYICTAVSQRESADVEPKETPPETSEDRESEIKAGREQMPRSILRKVKPDITSGEKARYNKYTKNASRKGENNGAKAEILAVSSHWEPIDQESTESRTTATTLSEVIAPEISEDDQRRTVQLNTETLQSVPITPSGEMKEDLHTAVLSTSEKTEKSSVKSNVPASNSQQENDTSALMETPYTGIAGTSQRNENEVMERDATVDRAKEVEPDLETARTPVTAVQKKQDEESTAISVQEYQMTPGTMGVLQEPKEIKLEPEAASFTNNQEQFPSTTTSIPSHSAGNILQNASGSMQEQESRADINQDQELALSTARALEKEVTTNMEPEDPASSGNQLFVQGLASTLQNSIAHVLDKVLAKNQDEQPAGGITCMPQNDSEKKQDQEPSAATVEGEHMSLMTAKTPEKAVDAEVGSDALGPSGHQKYGAKEFANTPQNDIETAREGTIINDQRVEVDRSITSTPVKSNEMKMDQQSAAISVEEVQMTLRTARAPEKIEEAKVESTTPASVGKPEQSLRSTQTMSSTALTVGGLRQDRQSFAPTDKEEEVILKTAISLQKAEESKSEPQSLDIGQEQRAQVLPSDLQKPIQKSEHETHGAGEQQPVKEAPKSPQLSEETKVEPEIVSVSNEQQQQKAVEMGTVAAKNRRERYSKTVNKAAVLELDLSADKRQKQDRPDPEVSKAVAKSKTPVLEQDVSTAKSQEQDHVDQEVSTATSKTPEKKAAQFSLASIFPSIFGHSATTEENNTASDRVVRRPPPALPRRPLPFKMPEQPARPKDPKRDVILFRSDYANNYTLGSWRTVVFFSGSYEDAQREARSAVKLIVVFIHDPTLEESKRFIHESLNSVEFADFVNTHDLLIWGVANDTEEGKYVAYNLHVNKYPFLSLMCPRADNRFFSARRITGFTPAHELVTRLEKSIESLRLELKDLREQRDKVLEDRRLMQEQEKAYKESAERDKQKMLEAKKARQEQQEAKEREEKKQKDEQERRQIIAAQRELLRVQVEEKPTGQETVRIQVRFPSGEKFAKKFGIDESLEKLFTAILCHETCPDFFTVASGFPRSQIDCAPEWYHSVLSEQLIADGMTPTAYKPPLSFRAAGFSKAVGVFVNNHSS